MLLIIADLLYVTKESLSETLLSKDIQSALILSIITSIITTLLSIIFAIPSAYALSRLKIKGSIVFDIIIDLLIVIPVLVVGVSLLVFFRLGTTLEQSPIFLLQGIGVTIQKLGEFFIYKKSGIVLAQFFCSIPFAVRVIKSTFDSLDPRTENVALTLGCTRGMAFWKITLPLARKGIVAGAVLAWARAFGLFGPVSIVAGSVRQKTEVLPTSIFLEISIGRLEVAIAISLLMIFIASGVLVLMRTISGGNLFGGNSR